jgi:hypothetical protein
MDGTFYSCPGEFEQLYTIQGIISGKFHPFVFNLSETMNTNNYELIFKF